MARRLVVVALAAVAGLVGCGDEQQNPGPFPRAGLNLTAYTPEGYTGPVAARAVNELVALGVRDVEVVTNWYMQDARADEIGPDPLKTPSDASLLAIIGRLQARGVRVVLKPHVDVRDGTFRGEITPARPQAWFGAYRAFVMHHARLAARAGVRGFVVGTELTSTLGDERAWRDLIATVRREFDGSLTYAANWFPGPEAVPFWDALDYVGVDAYVPLEGDSQAALVAAWKPYVQRWSALARRIGKPLVLTELGYDTAPADQALRYRAARVAWRGVARAIFWWDWSAEGRTEAFTPRGRPAERLLR